MYRPPGYRPLRHSTHGSRRGLPSAALRAEEAVSALSYETAKFARWTLPTKVVENVFNVLKSPGNRHVENVPHVLSGLLSETSLSFYLPMQNLLKTRSKISSV